jgi:tRNA-dihydrouridine synthase B
MDFIYALAPMEDITNDSFRLLAHMHGADLTFTEMAMFEALARDNKPSGARIRITDNVPTVIQLIGLNEYYLKKFLSKFVPSPGFMGFNLNLGCPWPGVTSHGMGCAMAKRVAKVKKLVQIFRERKFPISIKLRLGMNIFEKEQKVYLNLIRGVSADYFVLHARTGKQNYEDKPDWSVFPEVCRTGKTIIANGDVKTREDVELLKSYGVKGVMIGRAAIANPAIFQSLKGQPAPGIAELKREYLEISKRDDTIRYSKNVLKHMQDSMDLPSP